MSFVQFLDVFGVMLNQIHQQSLFQTCVGFSPCFPSGLAAFRRMDPVAPLGGAARRGDPNLARPGKSLWSSRAASVWKEKDL